CSIPETIVRAVPIVPAISAIAEVIVPALGLIVQEIVEAIAVVSAPAIAVIAAAVTGQIRRIAAATEAAQAIVPSRVAEPIVPRPQTGRAAAEGSTYHQDGRPVRRRRGAGRASPASGAAPVVVAAEPRCAAVEAVGSAAAAEVADAPISR